MCTRKSGSHNLVCRCQPIRPETFRVPANRGHSIFFHSMGIVFTRLFILIFLVTLPPASGIISAGVDACSTEPDIRILFDDLHGQTFGNADWTIDTAYSDFAEDLRTLFGATVSSSSRCGTNKLDESVLQNTDCLIIPEPNIRFSETEIGAVRQFVMDGGTLFMIADHGGADRNFNGWDSSLIFNEITEGWGITFLGDTFSETPLRGDIQQVSSENWPLQRISRYSIMEGTRAVSAWAATSIIIEPGTYPWHILLASDTTGLPFFACGIMGNGRVAAIGDSSAFDDGTGSPGKNRYNAYHSWLFDQRRLAVLTAAWLLQKPATFIPDIRYPFPLRTAGTEESHIGTRIVLDISRGNNDAGIMDHFGRDCIDQLSIPVTLNLSDYTGLKQDDILIIVNPDLALKAGDIAEISEWVRNLGGRLILCAVSPRNPRSNLSSLNTLLLNLNSSVRIQPTQLQHDTNYTGNPWSLLISRFSNHPEFSPVHNAVFWNSASLADTAGNPLRNSDSVKVLARSDPNTRFDWFDARNRRGGGYRLSRTDQLADGCAVAVFETIGKGAVIVLAANPFTNFQYIEESGITQVEETRWEHQTPSFNLALIKILQHNRPESDM
jgi:hypothetical protein